MMILEMSAGGAVLIAVVLLLRRSLLNRLPKWTFLLLWAVALCRLLVPFTIPSPVSVYTGAARVMETLEEPSDFPIAPLPSVIVSELSAAPFQAEETVSLGFALYLTGVSLCGLFFAAAYGWGLHRFRNARPAEQCFLRRWREDHPTLFPVQIKTCAAVNSPLAYGLLRPVILLPESTDWADEDQLTYILTHEYVHIRRGDLFWKLLLTVSLCLHWFNPLVWLMYFQTNRDLELACDEQVVHILGLDRRKGYAYALLSAAESGFSPLCLTYTTKNHMEERICAIMKMKQKSLAAILTAALLVAGVTAVFATSQTPDDSLPQAAQSDPPPVSISKPDPAPEQKPVLPNQSEENKLEVSAGTISAEPWNGEVIPVQTEKVSGTVNTPASQAQVPSAALDPETYWNLPDPIPEGAEFAVANEEEETLLLQYLQNVRGIESIKLFTIEKNDAKYVAVAISAPEKASDIVNNDYPVNSKGETYGTRADCERLGYDPDLIWTSSPISSGYAVKKEMDEILSGNRLEGAAYEEWVKTRGIQDTIELFDVNHDTIVGRITYYYGEH